MQPLLMQTHHWINNPKEKLTLMMTWILNQEMSYLKNYNKRQKRLNLSIWTLLLESVLPNNSLILNIVREVLLHLNLK